MRVIGSCLVLCLVVAGCSSEGETTAQPETASEAAASVEANGADDKRARSLDLVKSRLEQVGYRVKRVEASFPSDDALELRGQVPVKVVSYRKPENAAFDFEEVRKVYEEEFPGRGVLTLEGGQRLYRLGMPRRLRPNEIAEFERIVDVAEGRKSR